MIILIKYRKIRQSSQNDCAAACVATIASYYGTNIPISVLKEMIKIDKQGGTAYGVIEAGQKIGFKSEALQGNLIELLREYSEGNIEIPFIAHTITQEGVYHFVVITKINDSKICFFDPAIGDRELTLEEFEKKWTGTIISFELRDRLLLKSIFRKKNSLKSILKIFNLKSRKVIFLISLSLILTLANMGISLLYKVLLDSSLSGEGVFGLSSDANANVLSAIFLFFLGQAFLLIQRAHLVNQLSKNINDNLYNKYINRVVKSKMEYFSTIDSGEIISKAQAIIDIQRGFSTVILTVILESFSLIIGLILLLNISKFLSVFAIFLGVILGITTIPFIKPINKIEQQKIEANGNSILHLTEIVKGIMTIKSSDKEGKLAKKFLASSQELSSISYREGMFSNVLSSLTFVLESFFMISILYFGAKMVFEGNLTIGNLFAFLTIIPFFILPIKNIINLQPEFLKLKNSFVKVDEILHLPEENINMDTLELGNDKYIFSFENANFFYNHDKEILNNINYSLVKGIKVLLVGKSGTGKSTFIKLCTSILEINSGSFKVNKNLSTGKIRGYRNNIGYISQSPDFFSGTIGENVLLNSSEDALLKYQNDLQKIGFIDFIKELPLGLNTYISEQGANFSGGQRQVLSLARTILSGTNVFFVDEGSSSMDSELERKMFDYLLEKNNGHTVFAITHDSSYSKKFDEIITINKNKSIEYILKYEEI
ncbi:MAG: peptidase domain-containing ABC transporter [Streptococcaceae bacterium]|nr:peptidase domain-containing ABC transporter [Streptococcaceae bacterium]